MLGGQGERVDEVQRVFIRSPQESHRVEAPPQERGVEPGPVLGVALSQLLTPYHWSQPRPVPGTPVQHILPPDTHLRQVPSVCRVEVGEELAEELVVREEVLKGQRVVRQVDPPDRLRGRHRVYDSCRRLAAEPGRLVRRDGVVSAAEHVCDSLHDRCLAGARLQAISVVMLVPETQAVDPLRQLGTGALHDALGGHLPSRAARH